MLKMLFLGNFISCNYALDTKRSFMASWRQYGEFNRFKDIWPSALWACTWSCLLQSKYHVLHVQILVVQHQFFAVYQLSILLL